MRTHETGKICDGLWLLGREESSVYWLEGSDSAIMISGGISYIAADVERQIREFGLNEEKLDSALILHAHFDHVGIIPFLTRKYPRIKVYGSERAKLISANPKAVETINQFSSIVAQQMGAAETLTKYDLDWPLGLEVEVVHDGQHIGLGDRDVRIISTPGHSSCSISAYASDIKALFPSDAGGVPYKGGIMSAGNSNFTLYQESLEKLAQLDARYVCADHFGYIYGEEAASYIKQSIEVAKSDRADMEESIRQEGDVDRAAKIFTERFFAVNKDHFLSPQIFEGVTRQTMRHIAERLAS